MKVIDFKDARCRHCYKCVRYCDVKAILVKNEQAHIIPENCIHCGHCLEVCPQNAKTFASDMLRVKGYLRDGLRTVISIAPSYLGVFPYERPGQVVDALLKLGFSEVRETAEGAALVTAEYRKLLKAGEMENIITTCCPSVNDLIEKYYPSLAPMMAPVVSPMIAHGRMIKSMYGEDVKVVFLGPCIAKKQEAIGDERVEGAINAILTFEEVLQWLSAEKIDICRCEEKPMSNPSPAVNQLYPISGGVTKAVLAGELCETYHKVAVDGLKHCMQLFESMEKGELKGCFIEANVCEGGCVKGPASGRWNHSQALAKVKMEREVKHTEAAEKSTVDVAMDKLFYERRPKMEEPSEEDIKQILKATGKYTQTDELNCGACGYPTCREKARAVYQKKAELGMCLPYAIARAETMANVVMDETPNLIFIVDRQLRIQECNKRAQTALEISREEALERYLFEFMDVTDIEEIFDAKKSITNKKVSIETLRMTALEILVYIEEQDAVLVIYQDITKEEEAKLKRYQLKMETVEMAQAVIDKQMMVAQEIAGLLGETTAETKVTLSKLRDSILFDGEGE